MIIWDFELTLFVVYLDRIKKTSCDFVTPVAALHQPGLPACDSNGDRRPGSKEAFDYIMDGVNAYGG
ncbi:MAG TPA: hypothetical protein DD473_22760 [Planctomycetaceae bacterium]|nr:hypothetical protein [Planctomycetaceae bacterium]